MSEDLYAKLRKLAEQSKTLGGKRLEDLLTPARQLEQRSAPPPRKAAPESLSHRLGTTALCREEGTCQVREIELPQSHSHGHHAVEVLRQLDPRVWNLIRADFPAIATDLPVAFLDTETTGLAGGTGTLVFLVGIGYWQNNAFWVRQLFVPDFHEEPAMLAELDRVCQDFAAVVTYNGRAFDMALLRSRYRLYRMRSPLDQLPHLDLLPVARRLWKKRSESCALGYLEQSELGMHREGDVPGSLIPHLYFEYLRTGDARQLAPVLHHNLLDIVSLALLTWRTQEMFVNPLEAARDGLELFALARSFELDGREEEARRCYEAVLEREPLTESAHLARCQLASIHKRNSNWDRALELWQELAEVEGRLHLDAFEEIAKYYEHQARDFISGIKTVEQALDKLDSYRFILRQRSVYVDGSRLSERLSELRHRLRRLKAKASGKWSTKRSTAEE